MSSDIVIQSLDHVMISSELVASGGGNYYRNIINFHLSLHEDLSHHELENFTTELKFNNADWEVRLKKNPTCPLVCAAEYAYNKLILEEEVDMALEDFTHIKYRFPLKKGDAQVTFKIIDGKVHPLICQ